MKKIVFAAVFLLSISFVSAQVNLGIKAGYNSSLGSSDLGKVATGEYNLSSVTSELSNGFHLGVFTRISFNNLYFQPELLYGMGKKDYRMSIRDGANNTITYDKYVNIRTVDVPLLLGLKVLDFKLANLRVFAGPKLRFNSGSSLELRNLTGITQDQLVTDIKRAQMGLEAGFGVDILMLTLDARYNIIRDMYQTQINSLSIDRIPANTFVISLGWKFF